eukprot:Nitzschia sp. Nitz4//scaffold26_size159584//71802//72830//NITZ4_002491-RA/size159584-snap-gene-0.20-mRNA-1//1//CDS//3329545082//8501//frame0
MKESSPVTQYTLLSSSGDGRVHHHLMSQEAKNNIEEANEIAWATLVSSNDMDPRLPVKTVDPEYSYLKEAQKLTWTDDYFDVLVDKKKKDDQEQDEEGIIAVFDLDYEAMEQYYTDIGWAAFAVSIFVKPLFLAAMAGLYPCFIRKNVRWQAQAQHVAITEEGIRFVQEKRPSCWGLACTDRGKVSKTAINDHGSTPVPFDMITDCEVHEPAGNTCLCIPNVLTVVNLDNVSSGGKEIKIAGLKDPHGFQKMVWAMKRRGAQQKAGTTSSTLASQYDATTVQLLQDIREELRTNNALLQRQMGRGEPEVTNVMTRL